VYRQANIGRLRLHLGAQHWDSPQITGRWCVQPGDVVLNKLAPIRAAFVSTNAKRHPVDSNSLIIRGLSRPQAAWVAFCLNQPEYEELLLIQSGVLQRVGLGALASLRTPPVPPQMDGLSARLRDALDEQTQTIETLHRMRVEANESTSVALTDARPLGNGTFYARDAVTHDSWLPSATALRAEQTSLDEKLGWVPSNLCGIQKPYHSAGWAHSASPRMSWPPAVLVNRSRCGGSRLGRTHVALFRTVSRRHSSVPERSCTELGLFRLECLRGTREHFPHRPHRHEHLPRPPALVDGREIVPPIERFRRLVLRVNDDPEAADVLGRREHSYKGVHEQRLADPKA
jgi:hypothetical protein